MEKKASNKTKDLFAIQIRMPTTLADKIKAKAEKNRRSFNAQVVWYLEHFVDAGFGSTDPILRPQGWKTPPDEQ